MAEAIETTVVEPTQTEPTSGSTAQTQHTPTGKVYTDTYVHSLREEAKNYRIQGSVYENGLRKALGIKDGEEIGDIDKRISDRADAHQKELDDLKAQVNSYIINSELSKLIADGYNEKLLLKVIDMSNVKIGENNTVTGLEDAIKAAETEYPEVRKTKPPYYASGTGSSNAGNTTDESLASFKKALGL